MVCVQMNIDLSKDKELFVEPTLHGLVRCVSVFLFVKKTPLKRKCVTLVALDKFKKKIKW